MELETSSAIASHVGINQSQVFRNLFGQPKRVTRTLKLLCDYAYAKTPSVRIDPTTSPKLMRALAELWDGSDQHAELIVVMLRSIHRVKLK